MEVRALLPAAGFSAAVLLLAAPALPAQAVSEPKIETVRVGFPSGQGGQGDQESRRSRNGAWCPVYVKLKAGDKGNPRGAFKVVLETHDSEDAGYRYTVAVPALAANEDFNAVAYVRPGNDASDFIVTLQTASGRVVQSVPKVTRTNEPLGPRDQLYLAIGARLPGLRRALLLQQRQQNPRPGQPQAPNPNELPPQAEDNLEEGEVKGFGFLESARLMPDLWFGYDAVDMAVLTTSSADFVTALLGDDAANQRKALGEWVRRGGTLVVSVGHNHQLAAELLGKMPLPGYDKMPLLDCTLKGSVNRDSLRQVGRWIKDGQGGQLSAWTNAGGVRLGKVEVADLAPGPGVQVLVREPAADGDPERPVMVQASCGLGRVVLVAFDVDGPPFTTWQGQRAFWDTLVKEIGPQQVPQGLRDGGFRPAGRRFNPGFGDQDPAEIYAALQGGLENFEDVPVVSFGWVALFILVYIVLVGPLDYFVLKKVFKRLELTWITFPAVVLIISVAAYFTAYALKGDDLRVSKVDLVEIDLHTPQVYGSTWFALFSPRIQNYTIGVEPVAGDGRGGPGWVDPPTGGDGVHSTMVSVMDTPDKTTRQGSQGLFRRPYEYAPDAAGLERVPIPVWASRAFSASWRAPFNPDRPPIAAELTRRETADLPKGTIKNNLPVELQGVTVFWRGKWYDFGNLTPETGRNIEKVVNPQLLNSWFADPVLKPSGAVLPADRGLRSQQLLNESPYQYLKLMMFYNEAKSGNVYNAYLRPFDQSWRLQQVQAERQRPYREEVILVARTAPLHGPAEQISVNGASPTRLWLDHLPGSRTERPRLSGYLTQETYVRVYIPVKQQ
jgi:hypothetical protein